MSISVTVSDPTLKPKIAVTLSSSNGSTITSASLTRTAAGITTATRFQPTSGPSPRTVNDYEMPWNVGIVYTATVNSSAGTETFTTSAASVSPTSPWLIHPTTPGLSVVLDSGTTMTMGVVSLGAVSRPSVTTAHDVIGAKFRVITKTGPRQASRLEMTIATVTSIEENALWAIVDDQTPLLIRMPAGNGWNWEDGYYDVGSVEAGRVIQYGPEPRRTFTFPLERVGAPVGLQQSEWTWANVLSTFSSWSAVTAGYNTWADVVTNTRR